MSAEQNKPFTTRTGEVADADGERFHQTPSKSKRKACDSADAKHDKNFGFSRVSFLFQFSLLFVVVHVT